MSSLKNLDRATIDRYITRIRQMGGVEEDESHPNLLHRFRLGNSIVKVYSSKKGYTLYCNSFPTLRQITSNSTTDASYTDHIEIDDSGWGCEKVDADILTNSGWKRYNQLNPEDLIMTYLDSGEIKWSVFTKMIVYDFNGDLVHLHNRAIDIRITDNHHFKVLRRVMKRDHNTHKLNVIGYTPYYVPFKEMKSNDRIPRGGIWKGKDVDYFTLPEIDGTSRDISLKVWMEDWVAFLGIFLSDGSTTTDTRHIEISQTKPETKKLIRYLLKRLPFDFRERDDGFHCRDERLWSYLRRFGNCYNKYIPREILELSSNYLKILFDWLVLGDGNVWQGRDRRSKHTDYYTTSRKLKDDVEELLLKLGYSYNTSSRRREGRKIGSKTICSVVECYRISVRKGTIAFVGSLKRDKERYNGKVFDLEVPEGRCFFVRRSGKGYFTGNSPLLGMTIGMYHRETECCLNRSVGVEFFQQPLFKQRGYLTEVSRCCREMLTELDAPKITTLIECCKGYVFTDLLQTLTREGYHIITTKITGVLQSYVEKVFRDWVDDLRHSVDLTDPLPPSPRNKVISYDKVIAYIEQHPEILPYCKVGWQSFQTHLGNEST